MGGRVLSVGAADGGVAAEAHVQVFDLSRHIPGEMRLDAAAHGKAGLDAATGEGHRSAGWVPVGIDSCGDATYGDAGGMGYPSDGQSAGAIGDEVRCERHTQALAHRPEPIEVVAVVDCHRRIDGHPRVADRSRAQRARNVALGRELDVALKPGK
jgi:hypothetical protein